MKGQNLRLFIKAAGASGNYKPIAKVQDETFDSDVQTEDDSSKDTEGDFSHVEVTGKSYTLAATLDFDTATDSGGWTVAAILNLLGQDVDYKFAPASGTNNRTPGTAILSGTALISKVSITSTNRQKITASVNFIGQGAPA